MRSGEPRAVRLVEDSDMLPNTRFHSRTLWDSPHSRREFFWESLGLATGVDLVFFDPDNGVEVKSVG